MKKYIFIVGLLFPFGIFAQTILGKVTNNKKEPLIGASVYWLDTTIGVSTGNKGEFEISAKDISNKKLIASYVGHLSDTIEITNQTFVEFSLTETKTLNEVVVQGQRDGVIISDLKPIKTEQITQTELGKAACCDLAGCFETQTTVQPQTTNVITNSKELRILGLSGVYNQVLIDGFPMIQGLSYTYGISSIPGTLVDNIYVSKGANSVLQGYESISGQINVETKEPDKTDRLLLNAYMNNFLEKHFNANYALKQGKWSNLTAFHTVQPANKIDRDNDNFLDLPLLTRYMISNKWKSGNHTFYISLITDVRSRKIIGYSLDNNLKAQSSLEALNMAICYKPHQTAHIIHHSDRGSQYCSAEYVAKLLENNIKISMTESGEPTDNAYAERVNGILKEEYLYQYNPKNMAQAKAILAQTIQLYNQKRPHLSLENQTPNHVFKTHTRKFNRLWKSYQKTNFVNP